VAGGVCVMCDGCGGLISSVDLQLQQLQHSVVSVCVSASTAVLTYIVSMLSESGCTTSDFRS